MITVFATCPAVGSILDLDTWNHAIFAGFVLSPPRADNDVVGVRVNL